MVALSLAHHEVPIRDLDPAHDGVRIAHLTDVHVGLITPGRRIREAVALANAAEPDIVLLTGDYVCYARKFVPVMRELLGGLRASAGVIATLGNHDHWTDAEGVERALSRNGYYVLRNQNVELRPRGARLSVVGIDDAVTRNHDVAKAFRGVGHGTTVCLSHCPELADEAARRGAHVIVAGHTHGGHLHVRGVSERVYRRVTKRRYLSGWYEIGDSFLYVNRGIGSSSIPIRAGDGAKSEVALFTLRRAP